MLGPTVSLLPLPSAVALEAVDTAVLVAGAAVGVLAVVVVPPSADEGWRDWKVSGSRLPKKGFCTAIGSDLLEKTRRC